MNPKNFPARKLGRQLAAKGETNLHALEMARTIRTKKVRGTSTHRLKGKT